MIRRAAGIAADVVWVVTLALLVPYKGTSAAFMLWMMTLPIAMLSNPRVGWVLYYSYPMSLLIMLAASGTAVILAGDRRQALLRVALGDLIAVAGGLTLKFLYQF